MLTVRKQPAAFVMLLLVALPLFLAAGIYLKQQLIQYQRIQRFKTTLLETITIKAEMVDWVEAGEEIQIDGNLFDVESFKKVGGDMVLTGFYDYKEQELVKHINEIEQQKNKSGSPLNQLAVKFLLLPNYKEITTFSIQNNWQIITTRFPVYAESISNMVYPAVVPPPKYC
jgi:hypothetical protein